MVKNPKCNTQSHEKELKDNEHQDHAGENKTDEYAEPSQIPADVSNHTGHVIPAPLCYIRMPQDNAEVVKAFKLLNAANWYYEHGKSNDGQAMTSNPSTTT